jgi:hypothetical protein
MTTSRNVRRTASPVRVSLATSLTGDLDGAWWPRTGTMVRELPDLIDALHPALGEVLDIKINWSAASVTPVLSTMPALLAAKIRRTGPAHRLMSLAGSIAGTRILVVPAATPAILATMVLRQAAGRHGPDLECGTPTYEAAERIVAAARAESMAWSG